MMIISACPLGSIREYSEPSMFEMREAAVQESPDF